MSEIFKSLILSDKKIVVILAKKLDKKCSFKSGSDAQNLQQLAYWLYIFGDESNALKICEFSHIAAPEPFKIDFRVWDFILAIWSLQAYILRKNGDLDSSAKLILAINDVLLTPNGVFDTADKKTKLLNKIRARKGFDEILDKERIKNSEPRSAKMYKFQALNDMFDGANGFYPCVLGREDELESEINRYILELSSSQGTAYR